MFKGFGVKSIKKQFRVSEKVDEILKRDSKISEMSETDYLNILIVNAGEKFQVMQETEELLKNISSEVILYTENRHLGQTKQLFGEPNSINHYQHSEFKIQNSNNPNFKYWLEISNRIINHSGTVIFEAGQSYFFNDLQDLFFKNSEKLIIDRRNLSNTNPFLSK